MNRRGTSLVELMLVMSACVVVLTLSAELIHRAMLAHSKASSSSSAERTAQRLSVAFRRDVHDATSRLSEAEEGDVLLRLAITGSEVEYRLAEDTIERTVFQEGAVRAREQFVFPQAISPTVEQQSSGLISLSLQSAIETSTPEDPQPTLQAFVAPVQLQVRALLGRNARFADQSPTEGDSP